MKSHLRRLLLPPDHDPSLITNISSPSPPPPPSKIKERDDPTTSSDYSTTTCCFSTLKLNPPFDSAMALTVLVLLIALFMMGFFSIYIRRFADESSVDPTRRRGRRRRSDVGSATSYLGRSKKGVDLKMVASLPVHAYDGGGAKHGLECAICLSEFEEREWVKEIPYCGHGFHVECIDTWLSTHVTCPLCRTAKLFTGDEGEDDPMAETEAEAVAVAEEEEEERGLGVSEMQQSDGGGEVRVEVEEGDTRNENRGEREVGSIGARRSTSTSTSCSRAEGREGLHRSLSF